MRFDLVVERDVMWYLLNFGTIQMLGTLVFVLWLKMLNLTTKKVFSFVDLVSWYITFVNLKDLLCG